MRRHLPHIAFALVVLLAIGLCSYAITMAQTGAQLLPILQRGSTVAVAYYASRTTVISSTNLGPRSNGRVDAPGLYRLLWYLQVVTTSTSTDAKATFGWTDKTSARTLDSSTLDCTGQNYTQGTTALWVNDTVNPVTYTTSFTGGCTYSLALSLERLQ